jgi:hypothetical protein
MLGLYLVAFAFFTKVFGVGEGLLPENSQFTRVFKHFTLERGILTGAALISCAFLIFLLGTGNPLATLFEARKIIAGSTLFALGVQVIFASFFMSVLGLNTVTRHPPDPGNMG